MKLPRGVPAERLVKALEHLGIFRDPAKGQPCATAHNGPPPHTITVPFHDSLKTGSLHAILSEVARNRGVDLESIAKML